MEFLFFSVQIILILAGALAVVFARNMQIGFGGFSCVLMALSGFFLYSVHPMGLYLFHLIGCFTLGGFIYFRHAKTFQQNRHQPLDTHLGISRLVAILITFYFLGSILPFWPSELTRHPTLTFTLAPDLMGWIGGTLITALICTLSMIPLFKESTPE